MRSISFILLLIVSGVGAQQCTAPQCSSAACSTCSVAGSFACPTNSATIVAGATTLSSCTCVLGAKGPSNGVACTLCLAGTYASTTGNTGCTSCSAGTYLTDTGATSSSTCISCETGTWSSTTGASGCSSCGAGFYSGAVGAVTSGTCQSCAVGTYSLATTASSISTCVACPVDQYCSTPGTGPLPCTNAPSNAYYISPGTTATNCQWACSPQYSLSGGACVSCPANNWCISNMQYACPTNAVAPASSSSQNACMCAPGFYGNGTIIGTSQCIQCQAGSYCGGGNLNLTLTCPAFSTSPAQASLLTQCQCLPGYYGANGTACALCPAGETCASGEHSACPANSNSPAGTSGVCTCNAGWYSLTAGGVCEQCPINSYCTGGLDNNLCTANAVSAAGNPSPDFCTCSPTYIGTNNSACTPCLANSWCYVGKSNACPANSNSPAQSSYLVQCLCNTGYTGDNGGPCSYCPAGTSKSTIGNASCTGCSQGVNFTPNTASSSCTGVTNCAPSLYANPTATPTTDNVCVNCPANSICSSNAANVCPGNSVSPPLSSNYLNCTCPAGYTGQVTSITTSNCALCALSQFCPGSSQVCYC